MRSRGTPVASDEWEWPFNSQRLKITGGICGDAQEGEFMNATLQGTGKDDLEFSVAVHVEIPDEIDTEQKLADYLGRIFGDVVHQRPELHVEIQLGPYGDGWGGE